MKATKRSVAPSVPPRSLPTPPTPDPAPVPPPAATKRPPPRPRPTPPTEPVTVSPTIAVVRRPVLASKVRQEVLEAMGVTFEEISGRTGHPLVVWARRIITRLCRTYTTLSYPEIAKVVGRPNHSTVITADQLLDALLKLPPGHPSRAIPLEPMVDGRGPDVQALMAAIAQKITRDPLVAVLKPTESARPSV